MSNNNPHGGHINQTPQNSWNPLQIPSYIPRQPQLAHMSNERPMVRSPLAWHTPAPPPDTLYNFMSAANHKNLEHTMNPLLPPYVRGGPPPPPPFDSMDLSLQSNRNSPLNKSGHLLLPTAAQLDYVHGHKQAQQQQQQHSLQQQQPQMHTQNNYPIHNLSTNSPGGGGLQNVPLVPAPPTTSTSASTPAQNAAKYISSNGNNDCEQTASLIQAAQTTNLGSGGSNNSSSGSNYMRDSYGKMPPHLNRSYDNEPHSKSMQKPVELVNKDCSYNVGMLANKLTTSLQQQQQSSKKHSPLRSSSSHSYHQQQQSPYNSPAPTNKHNGPHTPPMTVQSPGMHVNTPTTTNAAAHAHQTLLHGGGGGSNNPSLLDFNQLHLQQHNTYTHTQSPGAHLQQQQQHLQHHAAYPPTSLSETHHQQHWQQQATHSAHNQQQSLPLPPPPPPQTHNLSQAAQHSPLQTNLNANSAAYANIRNESHYEQQRNMEHKSLITPAPPQPPPAAQATTPPQSTSLPAAHTSPSNEPRQPPPQQQRQHLPDTAESPDTIASSNDEDDSNDERQPKHKQSIPNIPSSPVHVKPQETTLEAAELSKLKALSNRSPKATSPRKPEIDSPESLDLTSERSKHATPPIATAAVASADDSEPETATLKNGRSTQLADVETIDKIAEMIAKTAGNSNHSSSIHSSSNSNDAHSNCSSSKSPRAPVAELTDSPKTKKQRQALKLRNSEHNTTDWSTNSYNDSNAATATTTAAPALSTTPTAVTASNNDDNAVLAEELRKDAATPTSSPTLVTASPARKQHNERVLSPPHNSRSCSSSSSSSSSSCSNSSRSSCGSKSQKSKVSTTKAHAAEKENLAELNNSNAAATNDGHDDDDDDDEVGQAESETKSPSDSLAVKQAHVAASRAAAMLSPKQTTLGSRAYGPPTASPSKSSFEEVENKLEEMFAGIEDEPPPSIVKQTPINAIIADAAQAPAKDAAAVATDLSVALELSNSLSEQAAAEILVATTTGAATDVAPPSTPTVPVTLPLPTKAAMKSTVPSPPPSTSTSTSPPPLLQATTTTENEQTQASTILPRRNAMPRRRLSVALDPANLRILLDSQAEMLDAKPPPRKRSRSMENKKAAMDAQLPCTSAASANTSEDSNKQVAKEKNRTQGKGKSSGGGGANKISTKKSAKKSKQSQKLQQQKGRKQSSSDDDVTRENNTAAGTTTAAAAAATNAGDKHKSPFILVKRDGSVSVINAATAEDVNADKQTKIKKPPTTYTHHERRNIRGFHSSTLSQKYDADTTDSTWICVFCKRGPHRMGLGDLFGPYIVTIDCEEYKNATHAPDALNLDDEFISKRRRIDMVQCGGARGLPIVAAMQRTQEAMNAATNSRAHKKKKKSIDGTLNPTQLPTVANAVAAAVSDPLDFSSETFLGMSKVSELCYEVWLHEDCAVWAPNVFLVGARISGLDAAVWNSTRHPCVLCAKSGATICCLQRNCKTAAHVPCAREASWSLNESNWHIHCEAHSSKSNTNAKAQDNVTQPKTTTLNP